MDYTEHLRRSPVFRNSFDPSKAHDSTSRSPSESPIELHLRPARHELQHFSLDLPHVQGTPGPSPFDRFDPVDKATPDEIPVLCEKQVTIIVLLARVCTVYDATPKTFVSNVLRLHRLGIIDSIAFLSDLGLLPNSPLTSPSNADYLEQWETDVKNLHTFPQSLNMSRYARDFEEISLLGQGGFGQVFKARHKLDGICYAIKQVQFLNKGYQSPLVQNVLREVHCLARCDHPNVNRYFGAWLEPTWIPMGSNLTGVPMAAAAMPRRQSSVSLSSIEMKQENRQLIEDIRRFVDIKSEGSDVDVAEFSSFSISHQSFVSSNADDDNSVFEFANESTTSMQSSFSDLPVYQPGEHSHASTTMRSLHVESSSRHHVDGQHTSFQQNTETQLDIVRKLPNRMFPNTTSAMEWDIQKTHLNRHWGIPEKKRALPRLGLEGETESVDGPGAVSAPFTYQVTLYIQMFLCEQSTLHDWIDDRNRNGDGAIDFEKNLALFRQLVEGLHHVHQNGIIHRDLKPSNVFMTHDGCLKIGDFGLSKLLAEVMKQDSVFGHESTSHSDDHTQGVGTMSYASPEQVSSQQYDVKADSYSLGIILLELFAPFQTRMERAMALKDIRMDPCILPCGVTEKYPEIAHLIKYLVAPTSLRWTMEQTREYLLRTFPQVQLEKAEEVLELRQKLKEKEHRLEEQDAMIEDLRRQLAQLSKE
ncbi:Aste57867_17300 [Aphanomyces stellatus]|uniref:non-specific serine/threonine protein kinase n=1 Tax=Aphanomyces stellatus TaxID=120398 RepID=A0A485L7I8_9STRA|nr:hypothetical protein As57867_017241 [Aphanomyces stellatus]KAF0713646.1 hypothetical protein As57867_004257 [Aphanomyces stellatus]VFT81383.1 Aste57867_4268 [Aphanomyces stellatus]VFT94056.1 Aste57867_17300 [Aphanomyces stellatus]